VFFAPLSFKESGCLRGMSARRRRKTFETHRYALFESALRFSNNIAGRNLYERIYGRRFLEVYV